MRLSEIRAKLYEYEALQVEQVLYQTLIAAQAIDCKIRGSIQINGRDTPFTFNVADQLVKDKATNRLTDVQTDLAQIEAMFGITP
jgi:hypothetical protein